MPLKKKEFSSFKTFYLEGYLLPKSGTPSTNNLRLIFLV